MEVGEISKKAHVNVCGGFALKSPAGQVVQVASRKACGLLAYLLLSPKGLETRERLACLLWSDRGEEQARASLRQCLKQLRELFGAYGIPGLHSERQTVSINLELFTVDLQVIEQQLLAGAVADELLGEDGAPEKILYGYEVLDESYASWLQITRQRWSQKLVDCLQEQLDLSKGNDAKRVAEALINIDPTHERAHRLLIRSYADSGNTPAALRQYKSLWDLLDNDYDMEPEKETEELIAEIKIGSYQSNSKPAQPLGGHTLAQFGSRQNLLMPQLPVLRIQKFATNGSDEIPSVIVDGFRQDLIASLVRFRDWVVIDGGQSQNAETVPQAAPSTGNSNSAYLVEANVYEDEGKFHLIITLKNALTQQYVWSERLRFDYENWYTVQRQFVMRISASMSIHLTAQDVAHQIAQHDISRETYLVWLEAYRLIWSWDPAARSRAQKMFREIIDQCPSFAPAYSGLTSIYSTEQMIYPGFHAQDARLEEGNKLARIAVSLDPLDVRNQIALAWSSGMTGRYDQAENHHRLVYDLNPNNPTTLISSSNGLAMCGDTEMARRLCDEAVQFLPEINEVQWGYLASTRFLCGEYHECISSADRANSAIPVTPGWKAAAMGHAGSALEAEEAGRLFMDHIRPRWSSSEPCEAPQVADWFLKHCPVKDRTTRSRIREGLARAGLTAGAA